MEPALAVAYSVPAPIQTCREARNLGLYKKTFSELEILPEGGESRYVWLNLEIDMIDVGYQDFPGKFWPAAASIQRLKLRYELWDWAYEDVAARASLGACKNLKEVHILCEDGFFPWAYKKCWSEYDWPCGKENVLFPEPGDDRLITGSELEEGNWVDTSTGRTIEDTRCGSKGTLLHSAAR